jgi:integrase
MSCCHGWSPHTKDWSYSIGLLRHRKGIDGTMEEMVICSLVMTSEAIGMGNLAAEQTVRTREYLTQREIDKLMDAARSGSRYGHRDSTMILIAYRHGLRASELCDLQWSQVDFNAGTLRVRRRKQGSPGTHPLQDDEIRALRRLQRGRFVFLTERDGPMTPKAFHALFARIGQRAELPFPVHPHMLRHTCGYLLANKGHDTRSLQAYLGHKNIQHTVRYTEMAPDRFRDFWKD